MSISRPLTEMLNEAIDSYESGRKQVRGIETQEILKRKGFVVAYISEGFLLSKDDTDDTIPVYILIFNVNEFAKLCAHSHQVVKCSICGITTVSKGTMIVTIAILGWSIIEFDRLIKSMTPYVEKSDYADKQHQIDSQRAKVAIDKANDTIKELRQELKAFRTLRKKEKKKDAIQPPPYIDERPPDF